MKNGCKVENSIYQGPPTQGATRVKSNYKMDECENLVIDLEEYEALDIKQQHLLNDNDVEILELTAAAALDTEEDEMVTQNLIYISL